ncbi:TadE/TadG family type IV pilus assembly protein [Hoeflea prorocentri]|uniref:Pilus assembly protein n=1 Tax=Hoeflea prorocentri TaxID=1922333 RepID=A0A9X3ULX5_9HYPH|nr:TadE/TadG family type IV pilus assembly protein [Hoeflea prorocentri]MCY6382976.1 pilus assembly protein [Hoeflea prorocentri]MDA5400776.1 pilus assembly protein [Hoeflea prorocentri]
MPVLLSKARERDARVRGLRRFSIVRVRRDENGATAIEFALLAIPFFLLIFAIIETCIAFAAEQTLNFAVDKIGRELRTGQITFNTGDSTDITEEQFKLRLCNEVSIMFTCGPDTDSRLFFDLQSYNDFASIPTNVPLSGGTLDTSSFDFDPGGPSTINVLRAYYAWKVTADLFRPYIANVRISGSSEENHYLIVATTAYRNEAYPTTGGS